MKCLILLLSMMCLIPSTGWAKEPLSVRYPGGEGPGKGKHVVLIAGDEEYRSEDSLPMLGKILTKHHGFDCTVLFSVSDDGFINPNKQSSLSNPEALDTADAIVVLIRFRNWPAEVMAKFEAAMARGMPVVALRTSTHAFKFPKDSPYVRYNNWGKDVLGENWVTHWSKHKVEATRGVVEAVNQAHPILRGVSDVFGNSDVYEAAPPADASILMRGQVLQGMQSSDAPASYRKKTRGGVGQGVNEPMMPVLWTRELPREGKAVQRIVTNTMGAATDLQNEGLRRLVINSVFWSMGMDVPQKSEVEMVGEFKALMYGFGSFQKNVRPSDHALKP